MPIGRPMVRRGNVKTIVSRAGALARGLARHAFVLVPFLFYYWTAAPGIGSSDTALVVDEAYHLNLSTHVNHHNLTLLLGKLFMTAPGPEPARLANLSSAFAGAVAVVLFYGLVLGLSRSRLVAGVGAAVLMVSHSMWWHSTIAEVYAVNAILTVWALLLLQRLARAHSDRTLTELSFVAGLAFFNHIQMGILLAGTCAYLVGHIVRGRRIRSPWPYRLLAGCVLRFGIGFLPYAITFVVDVWRSGELRLVLARAVGSDFSAVMARGSPDEAAKDLLFLITLQFPTPFLIAVAVGLNLVCREWRASPSLLALGVMLVLNTGFFAFYATWDKFAFLLPSFIILAYAGSFAVRRVVEWASWRGSKPAWLGFVVLAAWCVLVPPVVYSRLVSWAEWGGRLARFREGTGPMDTSRYRANPNKRHFREFEDYVRLLLERLPPDSIYIDSDAGAFYLVLYFQHYQRLRPDVRPQLVNFLGIKGWGLDRGAFRGLLLEAHRDDRPLYVITIREPFYGLIVGGEGLDRLRFQRFTLDGRYTIYRLVGVTEEARTAPEPPSGVRLGLADEAQTVARRRGFGPRERVFARLDFELNSEPFDVDFWWWPPRGGPAIRGRSAFVPFGCTGAWSELEDRRPLRPGRWRVEARVAGSRLADAGFEVRRGAESGR